MLLRKYNQKELSVSSEYLINDYFYFKLGSNANSEAPQETDVWLMDTLKTHQVPYAHMNLTCSFFEEPNFGNN